MAVKCTYGVLSGQGSVDDVKLPEFSALVLERHPDGPLTTKT